MTDSVMAIPGVVRKKPRLRIHWGPFEIASAMLLAILVFLIAYPLAKIFWEAFNPANGVGISDMWARVSDASTLAVLSNTFIAAGISSVAAVVIGAVFAWLIERTDAKTGLSTEFLPLIPLLVPQISGVIGWVMLLSPQAGLANGILRWFAGLAGVDLMDGPVNIFTFSGMICVMTLYMVPYVYLTVGAALRGLNPSYEEASRMCGASAWRTLRRVTLPAVWPAIVNAFIIVLIFGFSLFSVPIVIGTSAGIDVLSVTIYRLLYNHPPNTGLAVVLSLAMMVIVQAALFIQVLISRAGRHAVIAGKGSPPSRIPLGSWRWVARSSINLYLLFTAVIPIVALVIVSLQPYWTPNVNPSAFTLDNFKSVLFEDEMTSRALVNSIGIGVVGATVGMLCAAVLVIFAKKATRMGQMAVEGVTSFPATLPHTVVAVGMVLAFTGGLLNLHGTMALLLIAYLILVAPQAMRAAQSAAGQVGADLVEAAQMARSSAFKTFRRIQLPLMSPGLVAGWVILFVLISGELTASALLSGTNNPVVGLVLLNLWENGSFPQLSAIALIMTALDSVVVLTVMRLVRSQKD